MSEEESFEVISNQEVVSDMDPFEQQEILDQICTQQRSSIDVAVTNEHSQDIKKWIENQKSLEQICLNKSHMIILNENDDERREAVLRYLYCTNNDYHLLTSTAILIKNQSNLQQAIRNMFQLAQNQFNIVTEWLIISDCTEHFGSVLRFLKGQINQFTLLRNIDSDQFVCNTKQKKGILELWKFLISKNLAPKFEVVDDNNKKYVIEYLKLDRWNSQARDEDSLFKKIDTTWEKRFSMLPEIIDCLRKKDLSAFINYWSPLSSTFQSELLFLINKWSIFEPGFDQVLIEFSDLLANRITSKNCHNIIFSHLPQVTKRLQLATAYIGNGKSAKTEESTIDLLYFHFISELFSRTTRQGVYMVKDERTNTRLPIRDFIALCEDYNDIATNIRWQQIFARLEYYNLLKKQAELNNEDAQNVSQEKKLRENFLSEIHNECLIPLDCMGCCEFFYLGQNIFDPEISSTPVLVHDKISKLKQEESRIKDEICWLLNNHGGVILFDCERVNRQVLPVGGQSLTLQDMQQIEQRVYNFLGTIYPKPAIDTNILVTFIPIKVNPMKDARVSDYMTKDSNNSYEHEYYNHYFKSGQFVTRIKVNPTSGEKLYFWTSPENRHIFPCNSKGSGCLTGTMIVREIKRKFNQYYMPQSGPDLQQRQFGISKASYFHSGECKKPLLGDPATFNSERTCQNNLTQKEFRYMSLLIVHKFHHQTIKERLEKRNIDCKIESVYQKYKFKAAINSAILHHNIRFDNLLHEVSYKKDFEFEGRYMSIVFISDYLRLLDRSAYNLLPEQDFESLTRWLSEEHKDETLKLWKYNTEKNQSEFYLQTDSRRSSVLMYYVLNHFDEKVIFKNPKNFDKLSSEEKANRFKLFYPRTSRFGQSRSNSELDILCYSSIVNSIKISDDSSQNIDYYAISDQDFMRDYLQIV